METHYLFSEILSAFSISYDVMSGTDWKTLITNCNWTQWLSFDVFLSGTELLHFASDNDISFSKILKNFSLYRQGW
jgi:hypothetical protein